jgi:hypothetical protein
MIFIEKTWPQGIYVSGWKCFWMMNLPPRLDEFQVCIMSNCNDMTKLDFFFILINEWNNWMWFRVISNEISFIYGTTLSVIFHAWNNLFKVYFFHYNSSKFHEWTSISSRAFVGHKFCNNYIIVQIKPHVSLS